MIFHHSFSPEIFTLGPFTLRWYGLLYVAGLITAYLLAERRLKHQGLLQKGAEGHVLNVILITVIVGARLGYCLFYNLPYYISNPIEIFYIWKGGLSFHGALIGVLIGMWFLGGRTIEGMYRWGDCFALYTPIGLGLGRLGNFMNSELLGRATNGSWGIIYDLVDTIPRHPSQLYEAALEGLCLFLILKWISKKTQVPGVIFWAFISFYGLFRFAVEFFREPDIHLGLIWGPLTLGQILTIPMLLLGFGMMYIRLRKDHD